MILLITLSQLQDRYDVSGNIPERRINAAIVNAQEMGLYNLVGKDLYNRVINEMGGTPSAAIEALVSEAVPYLSSKTMHFLAKRKGQIVGAYGNGRMQSDVFSDSDAETSKEDAAAYDAEAQTGASRLIDFIRDNIADYPEFNACNTTQQSGPRIWQVAAKYNVNA